MTSAFVLPTAAAQDVSRSFVLRSTYYRALHSHIVISVLLFALLLHVFTGAADLLKWPAIAALLVLVLGVPHGALDVALASHRQCFVGIRQTAAFLLKYIGLAGAVAGVWLLWPSGSLAAFLLLAAYHFGGDWTFAHHWTARLMLGAALLCATTMFHSEQVELVFSWLTAPPEAAWISRAMYTAAPLVIASAVLNAARTTGVGAGSRNEFIIVLVSALVLPPITFFVLYFCLLHSIRHVFDIRAELASTVWASCSRQVGHMRRLQSFQVSLERSHLHTSKRGLQSCHLCSFRWLR